MLTRTTSEAIFNLLNEEDEKNYHDFVIELNSKNIHYNSQICGNYAIVTLDGSWEEVNCK